MMVPPKYKVNDVFIELDDPNSRFVICIDTPVERVEFCDYTNSVIVGHYYGGVHYRQDPELTYYESSTGGLFFSENTLDSFFIIQTPTTEVLFGNK